MRYPMESRIAFIECAGNSASLYQKEPAQLGVQPIHGLLSCAEWTGVRLATLLEDAGVDPRAQWILAEGADASGMSRSVPLEKAMGDALVAIYQNGEPVRPSNGYPMRLLLPGYEGNMNVKWLRRIKVTAGPTMTKDETSKYTDLQANGTALMFTFPMDVKSLITRPSPGLTLQGPGWYEVSGLAWSGRGAITQVDVSVDGGHTWATAVLSAPVLPRALTRFRLAWQWHGAPTVLKSRATDDTGAVQPTRDALVAAHGTNVLYHYNAIQAWQVAATGEVTHVYA
jgi:sulfane dehydrogenase subunit SoxC